jgi:hypothetical protein
VIEKRRNKVTGCNRAIAFALAAIWLCAGTAGVYAGCARNQIVLAVCGVLAVAYALLWLRVAAHSRLLSWREVVLPWRA